jgi:hypothetical protein
MDRIAVHLRIVNGNDFAIEDRYDGVPYVFEAGKALTVPPEAALHIFGWKPGLDPRAIETHITRRWGWNTPKFMESGDAKKFFAKLEFKPVTFKTVEVVSGEDDDPLPSPIPPRAEKRDASA